MRTNGKFHDIKIDIAIVQNTLQFEVYGAIVRVQNYFVEVEKRGIESASVDVMLTIIQVTEDVMMQANLIKVNRITAYRGNDRGGFVRRLPKLISDQWNKK
jgi:hypothetical protein